MTEIPQRKKRTALGLGVIVLAAYTLLWVLTFLLGREDAEGHTIAVADANRVTRDDPDWTRITEFSIVGYDPERPPNPNPWYYVNSVAIAPFILRVDEACANSWFSCAHSYYYVWFFGLEYRFTTVFHWKFEKVK